MKALVFQKMDFDNNMNINASILNAFGIETLIIPTKIMDNTDLDKFISDKIEALRSDRVGFDAIYVSYVATKKQFDYVLDARNYLLKDEGLFIVDPNMADNNEIYSELDEDNIIGNMNLAAYADMFMPNITEACLMTRCDYKEVQDNDYLNEMIGNIYHMGCKNLLLTSVADDEYSIGAIGFDGLTKTTVLKEKMDMSYPGLGNIFRALIVGNMMNGLSLRANIDRATDFISDAIENTMTDPSRKDSSNWTELLPKYIKKYYGED